jgi:hypothetical protein
MSDSENDQLSTIENAEQIVQQINSSGTQLNDRDTIALNNLLVYKRNLIYWVIKALTEGKV